MRSQREDCGCGGGKNGTMAAEKVAKGIDFKV
jgi:hypothetical protein